MPESVEAEPGLDVDARPIVLLFEQGQDRMPPDPLQPTCSGDPLGHQVRGPDLRLLVLDATVERVEEVSGPLGKALAGEPASEQSVNWRVVGPRWIPGGWARCRLR